MQISDFTKSIETQTDKIVSFKIWIDRRVDELARIHRHVCPASAELDEARTMQKKFYEIFGFKF
jgi:hypothetical protein